MEFATTARVRLRWGLAAAVCGLVALAAAVVSVSEVSVLPPSLKARQMQIAAASTHAQVEPPHTNVVDSRMDLDEVEALARRTVLLTRLMTSEPVLERIGRRAGVPPQRIAGVTPFIENIPEQLIDPESETRANDILRSAAPFRLNVQPKPGLPAFDIYAQAPTPVEARRLADAAVPGLRDHLQARAVRHGVDPAGQMRLEQLGRARGDVINGGAKIQIAALTFLVVFGLCAAVLLLASRVRRGWVLARHGGTGPEEHPVDRAPDPPVRHRRGSGWGFQTPLGVLSPAAAAMPAGGAVLPPLGLRPRAHPTEATRGRIAARAAEDWPRTTRILPWMIAAFMAILWLVPFNSIALSASLPIDLKFDRLVLPLIVVTWMLALAAGGAGAPRLRSSWVHWAVGAFAVLACISLVVNADHLNRMLELDLGVKRLTLLLAYVSLFVVVASVVRRSELRTFLRYNLLLAAICALGTIWEYRFRQNLFYDLADVLLPAGFQVGAADPGGIDDLGRRVVRGPAELPLEAVGMFTMALPIALVELIDAKRWGERLLYGLAAAVLLAAVVSTYRKSAILAPVAVVLTLAYFRRKQLLRLAPLGVVLLVAVKFLSPGALGSLAFQLDSKRLGVNTVSDRTLDYDAVRPDVWSHLAFGQGFGTYDQRVLDMEILARLVEGGVLGLAAYLLIILSVLALARGPIRRRDPTSGPVALAVAAAAAGLLVLSALFDVMAFPHIPYIFLCLAALLVVAVTPSEEPAGARASPAPENAWSC
jgi:hypothetical protein